MRSLRLNAAFLVDSPPLIHLAEMCTFQSPSVSPQNRMWRPLKALFILPSSSSVQDPLVVTFTHDPYEWFSLLPYRPLGEIIVNTFSPPTITTIHDFNKVKQCSWWWKYIFEFIGYRRIRNILVHNRENDVESLQWIFLPPVKGSSAVLLPPSCWLHFLNITFLTSWLRPWRLTR